MIEKVQIHKKNVKNITLRVKKDGTVHLSVPKHVSDEYIQKLLIRKQSWIEAKLKYFSEIYEEPKEKQIISGEVFNYLGKKYILKIIESSKEYVQLKNEYMELYVKNSSDFIQKEKIIKKWYLENAKLVFKELVQKYEIILKKEVNNIRIKTMKTRWGSCNYRTKNVNFNLLLMEKPISCIEYVVLHELAHLTHPNHSKDFWDYVITYMPDWKDRKKLLESFK